MMEAATEFQPVRCEPQRPARAVQAPVTQKLWLRDIIRILCARSPSLHIEQLERMLWELHHPGLPMPLRFRNVVQGIIAGYSSQSMVFRQKRRRPPDDLFYSPEGKGSGTWAVHRATAEAWLRNHPIATSPAAKKS